MNITNAFKVIINDILRGYGDEEFILKGILRNNVAKFEIKMYDTIQFKGTSYLIHNSDMYNQNADNEVSLLVMRYKAGAFELNTNDYTNRNDLTADELHKIFETDPTFAGKYYTINKWEYNLEEMDDIEVWLKLQ